MGDKSATVRLFIAHTGHARRLQSRLIAEFEDRKLSASVRWENGFYHGQDSAFDSYVDSLDTAKDIDIVVADRDLPWMSQAISHEDLLEELRRRFRVVEIGLGSAFPAHRIEGERALIQAVVNLLTTEPAYSPTVSAPQTKSDLSRLWHAHKVFEKYVADRDQESWQSGPVGKFFHDWKNFVARVQVEADTHCRDFQNACRSSRWTGEDIGSGVAAFRAALEGLGDPETVSELVACLNLLGGEHTMSPVLNQAQSFLKRPDIGQALEMAARIATEAIAQQRKTFASRFRHDYARGSDGSSPRRSFFEFKNHFYGPLESMLGDRSLALDSEALHTERESLNELADTVEAMLYRPLCELQILTNPNKDSEAGEAIGQTLDLFIEIKVALDELPPSLEGETGILARSELRARLLRIDAGLVRLASTATDDSLEPGSWPSRLLLVDDHHDRWKPLLHLAGATVTSIHPQEFLLTGRLDESSVTEFLRKSYSENPAKPPPILLLDMVYSQPRRLTFDGFDVLRVARAKFPEILVVMVTIVDDPAVGIKVAAHGAAGHFVKGNPPSHLAAYLSELVSSRWPSIELHQRLTRLSKDCPKHLRSKLEHLRQAILAFDLGDPTTAIVRAKLAAMGESRGEWPHAEHLRQMRNIVAHDWSQPAAYFESDFTVLFSPQECDAEVALRIAIAHLESIFEAGGICRYASPSWTNDLHAQKIDAVKKLAAKHQKTCGKRQSCQACEWFSGSFKAKDWQSDFYYTNPDAIRAKKGNELYYRRVVVPAIYMKWKEDNEYFQPAGADSRQRDDRLKELVWAIVLEQLLGWIALGLPLAHLGKTVQGR